MLLPSFLKMPIYALELSDESFKYLRMRQQKGGLVVEDFGEGAIAPGVIDRGEIKKPDILKSLLKELFAKKNIKFAAISLPEEKGFLRNVKLKGVKEEEMRSSLELQLEEHIPMPPQEVIFDYAIVGKAKEHFDVVINAFPRIIVESYLDAFAAAGATPALVESELAAMVEAVLPKNFVASAMIIDWGKTRTSFAIAKNRILRFASTVPIGGKALDEAIAKNLKVSIKDAEALKIKHGFSQTPEAVPSFQAIVPIVTALREEAERYINFWQTHSEDKKAPQLILLTGGDANLIGLTDYLQSELGIPTMLANPWANVIFPRYYLPELEKRGAIRFAASVGLAIKALDKENIL